jgi:uncharacterized membrane protein
MKKTVKKQRKEKKTLVTTEFFIGQSVFIRTITYHATGKIIAIIGNFFVLSEAAWIADSGRFMNAILKGELNEVEPVDKMYVNIDSIVDILPWGHALPRAQK